MLNILPYSNSCWTRLLDAFTPAHLLGWHPACQQIYLFNQDVGAKSRTVRFARCIKKMGRFPFAGITVNCLALKLHIFRFIRILTCWPSPYRRKVIGIMYAGTERYYNNWRLCVGCQKIFSSSLEWLPVTINAMKRTNIAIKYSNKVRSFQSLMVHIYHVL